MGRICVSSAHIAGHNCATGVSHDENMVADRQPHHPLHLSTQRVINGHLELGRASQTGHWSQQAFSKCTHHARHAPWRSKPPRGARAQLQLRCVAGILSRGPCPGATLQTQFRRRCHPHARCHSELRPQARGLRRSGPRPRRRRRGPAHALRSLAERTDTDVELAAKREVLLRAAEPRQRVAHENLGRSTERGARADTHAVLFPSMAPPLSCPRP